ncbi:cation diffusion facilitator family transporter [Bacillaceae bacterium]
MKTVDFHHLEHVKEQPASKKTLWVTMALCFIFTIVEVIGGLLSRSLALLSDSAHMISDVFALGLSMFAIYMATRKPNHKYTFGFLRLETIASFMNGLALVAISIFIFIEGMQRMISPQEIDLGLMLVIAVIGFFVNVTMTIVLSRGLKEEENLNVKSALWHFIGDLLSSIGVIVSAILIHITGLQILDPLISIMIGGIICFGGSKIIRQAYLILMEAVPDKFDLENIRADLQSIDGVEDVHEMHLWAVSSDHYSLTAHVFIRVNSQPFQIIQAMNEMLNKKYGIVHSTIQIEHPSIHDHGEYGRRFLCKVC